MIMDEYLKLLLIIFFVALGLAALWAFVIFNIVEKALGFFCA